MLKNKIEKKERRRRRSKKSGIVTATEKTQKLPPILDLAASVFLYIFVQQAFRFDKRDSSDA